MYVYVCVCVCVCVCVIIACLLVLDTILIQSKKTSCRSAKDAPTSQRRFSEAFKASAERKGDASDNVSHLPFHSNLKNAI